MDHRYQIIHIITKQNICKFNSSRVGLEISWIQIGCLERRDSNPFETWRQHRPKSSSHLSQEIWILITLSSWTKHFILVSNGILIRFAKLRMRSPFKFSGATGDNKLHNPNTACKATEGTSPSELRWDRCCFGVLNGRTAFLNNIIKFRPSFGRPSSSLYYNLVHRWFCRTRPVSSEILDITTALASAVRHLLPCPICKGRIGHCRSIIYNDFT